MSPDAITELVEMIDKQRETIRQQDKVICKLLNENLEQESVISGFLSER